MARQPVTPLELARRAGCETDDVLILLWDAGIEYPTSPTAIVKPQDVARAERACGLAPARQKTQVDYWMRLLDLDREEFTSRARLQGIIVGANSRRLPKGALAKLERGLHSELKAGRPVVSHVQATEVTTKVPERFVWHDVGHLRDSLQYLTSEDIESVHFAIAEDFRNSPDPISPTGVRSRNLLESAAYRPMTGLGESRKYQRWSSLVRHFCTPWFTTTLSTSGTSGRGLSRCCPSWIETA